MKPVSFPEQNTVFGTNQPEYQSLPAFIGSTSEAQAVTWQNMATDANLSQTAHADIYYRGKDGHLHSIG